MNKTILFYLCIALNLISYHQLSYAASPTSYQVFEEENKDYEQNACTKTQKFDQTILEAKYSDCSGPKGILDMLDSRMAKSKQTAASLPGDDKLYYDYQKRSLDNCQKISGRLKTKKPINNARTCSCVSTGLAKRKFSVDDFTNAIRGYEAMNFRDGLVANCIADN
jgi:hypothetical protein